MRLKFKIFTAAHLSTTGALLASAAMQAAAFFVLARGLGATDFGRFMVLAAVTQFAADAVSLGAGEAMIRRVSRDAAQYPSALGHALVITAASGLVFCSLAWAIIWWTDASVPLAVAGTFAFGEMLGVRLAALSEHAFMGRSRVQNANHVRIAVAAAKLLSVLIAFQCMASKPDLYTWPLVQGLTSLAAGLLILGTTIKILGTPRLTLHHEDVGFGVLMSLTQLSSSIQFTADRYFLGLTAPAHVVGAYSAGVRGIQLGLIPIQAVSRNMYASFFSVGKEGVGASWDLVKRNFRTMTVTGLTIGLGLFATADAFALLLGKDFAMASTVLRALCLVPLARGVQSLLADALTGAGYQGLRTSLVLTATGVFLVALVTLTGKFGVWGVISAIYMQQICLSVAICITFLILVKRRARTVNKISQLKGTRKSQRDSNE